MKRWYEGLRKGDHAAHIYRSDAEQVRVVTETISWLSEDQRLVLLSDRWDRDARAPRSRVLDAAIDDGHLTVVPARETLCAAGDYRPEALEAIMLAEAESAIDDGASDLVLMWDLDWLGEDDMAFEAHIVQMSSISLSPSSPHVTLLGQYGIPHYSPEQVERILRVSPLVLESGLLTRKFWVVSKNSVGKASKDGRRLLLSVPDEATGAR